MDESISQASLVDGRTELKSVRDNLEYLARLVLQFKLDKLSENEKQTLQNSLRSLFEPYSKLEALIDYYTKEIGPQNVGRLCQIISELMQGAFHIGALAIRTDFARSEILKEPAKAARAKKSESTTLRKKKILRPAIEEAERRHGKPLANSAKCAEAIAALVREIAKVKPGQKGYSNRVIQREIGAILEERRRD